MSQSARAEACRRVEEIGLVPVVRVPSAELAIRAVEAVLAGGVSIFEITLTVPGAVDVIRTLSGRFGDRALVGAGTVLTAEDARRCVDAGARFVVSPGLDLETVAVAQKLDVAVMPGALSPTEVITAFKAGADMVKIFPCSAVGGAKYLKALRGPLPQVKLLPTGGVNLATAAEYIEAGAAALGIGSELVDVAVLKAGGDAEISARARALLGAVTNARERLSTPPKER
jgi:2-dehydro-3-deoxyphosphogluconate aldolase / (4S)-4-hydroxy-2-oxoglutarate aldolase